MCFKSSSASSATPTTYYRKSDGSWTIAEQGLPQEAIDLGYNTNTAYQYYLEQKLSDEQIAAQKEINAQQEAYNQQSLQYQKDIQAAQQQAADEQSARQTAYDEGRAKILSDATNQINNAFSGFTPEYFKQYASDYMSQVQDQVDYQKNQAIKSMNFGLARQGLSDSQAKANQMGLLEETAGRTLADQTKNAQDAANTLQGNVTNAKNSLLNQVVSAESLGSPTAASTIGEVNNNLNTSQQTVSGISNSANDVTASLRGVPQVSTLGNIFSGVLSSVGSYLAGGAANTAYNRYMGTSGLSGTSPSGGSTQTNR